EFSVRARPLAERNLLGVLTHGPTEQTFAATVSALDKKAQALVKAREKTGAWRELLSADDTENALVLAQGFEKSIFRFLKPAFWRLKKTLQERYDFSRHAVAPAWTKILGDLSALHKAQAESQTLRQQAAADWRVEDVDAFRNQGGGVKTDLRPPHPSVQGLLST